MIRGSPVAILSAPSIHLAVRPPVQMPVVEQSRAQQLSSVVPIVSAPEPVDPNVPMFPANVKIPTKQVQGLTRATLPEAETGMSGIMNTEINLDVYKIMTVDHLRRIITKYTTDQSIVKVKQMWFEHSSRRTIQAENTAAQIIISKR